VSESLSFGMWLRQRRKRHDLTQAELARQVGCALGTLRNIETDSARPSKQLAARLARTLGVADTDIDAVVAFARGSGPPSTNWASPPRAPSPSPIAPIPTHRTNLPAQLTGLIGRMYEVEAVCALLLRPDVRLVTLTGPGGTGKTRVAVQVVDQLLDAFPNGVSFIDLAAISDPELVLATIAQTLGVPEGAGQPLRVELTATLRDRSLLLLLDNFEQVVEAAPAVADLLAACPRLKVLITSRIALEVAGEYEWPVPPLALPDRGALPPFEQLTQYESIRLFGERARAVNPQFAITTSNAPAVAEICYQLDGLPLAIELVAAWAKLFEPQALLARLDRRLRFLTGGRDRPTRQQTMRNTIAWSYQLLKPDEQALFQRLSVFMGGGTLAAIAAVCGDSDQTRDADMIDGVAALVSQSLLRTLPEAPGNTGAEPRFGMLETIREYALEQLAVSPDAEAIRRRHAHYFTALAEVAAAQWDTSMINVAIALQRREHDNMRAALQWACDTGDSTQGFQLAQALWGFWRSYGSIGEGRAWLEQLLALDEYPPDHAAMAARQHGLHAAAWLASDQHDYARAAQLFEQSMVLRRALGETAGETDLLINAARQARAAGQYQQATTLLEDALSRHRPVNDRASLSSAKPELSFQEFGQMLRELALVLRERGDFARSVALLDEALVLYRMIGDRVSEALALLGLGDVARDQGDGAQVREYCEPSLAILRESDMHWAIGFALNSLALAAYYEDDLARALTLIQESVALFRGLKADGSLAEVLITLGKILQAHGDAATAFAAIAEALRLALAVGPRLMVVGALEELASVVVAHGHVDLAVRLLAAASAIRVQMGAPVRPADRAAIDQAQVAARAALGDAFAAISAQSENLSLDKLLNTISATRLMEARFVTKS
jgi:predicted ATPase/transcriptional regulator with XRE-family HTH domain